MDEDSEALINSFKNKQGSSPNPLPGLFKIHGAQGRSYKAPSIWPFFSVYEAKRQRALLETSSHLPGKHEGAAAWMGFVLGASTACTFLCLCGAEEMFPEQGSHTAP